MRPWVMALVMGSTLPTTACARNTVSSERAWSESVEAPGNFEFWRDSGHALALPTTRDEFLSAVAALGGSYYIPGEGDARSLNAPPPSARSPCQNQGHAIVVAFPQDRNHVTPQYVAYLNDEAAVVCIDKQFSFLSR